jgi:hypothetical protein
MNGKFAAYAAAIIACFILSPVANAKAVENYKWIEVRSENFVIRSLLSKRQTEKVARHLEMARAVIPESIRSLNNTSPEMNQVYLVKGPGQLNELGTEGDAWAFTNVRKGQFVVGADVYAENRSIRIYAASLVANPQYRRETLWYSQGLYIYFERARIRDARFRYGGQSARQRQNPSIVGEQLDIVLSEEDLTKFSDSRSAKITGYSWFLVRYLTHTDENWQAFGNRLASYNRLIEEGETVRAAFESAFEVSADTLGEAVADFSTTCCAEYVVAVDTVLPKFEVAVSKLSREEISLDLAGFAASNNARDRALDLYEIALGSDATREAAQAGIDALGAATEG